MSDTVLASVLHGARDLRLESYPISPPSANEVQIRIQTTTLCGSDLHYYTHYRNGDIQVREPLTLGHESSGVVVALPSPATAPSTTTTSTVSKAAEAAPGGLKVGDRVALEVGLPCEQCELCFSGRYNVCPGMKFRSSAKAFPHAQGTLQERVNHPGGWCHKLPPSVTPTQASLVEPLAVAKHAHNRSLPLPPNPTVLILGAGAVGLLCAAVCKASSPTPRAVIIADVQPERIRFALENGFADAGVVVPLREPSGGGG